MIHFSTPCSDIINFCIPSSNSLIDAAKVVNFRQFCSNSNKFQALYTVLVVICRQSMQQWWWTLDDECNNRDKFEALYALYNNSTLFRLLISNCCKYRALHAVMLTDFRHPMQWCWRISGTPCYVVDEFQALHAVMLADFRHSMQWCWWISGTPYSDVDEFQTLTLCNDVGEF